MTSDRELPTKRESSTRLLASAVRQYYRNAPRIEIFATVFLVLGVLNFMIFMAFCMNIGGSAGNGEIRNGSYFVSEHGKEHEVSAFIFELNKVHGNSLWFSHSMAMLGMLVFVTSSLGTQSQAGRRKKPNKAEMATPRKPSD